MVSYQHTLISIYIVNKIDMSVLLVIFFQVFLTFLIIYLFFLTIKKMKNIFYNYNQMHSWLINKYGLSNGV